MKKFTIAIVCFVIIAAAIWFFQSPTPANAPAEQTASEDTTASINAELQSIDIGNVDEDFNSIDKDINTL